MENPTHKLQKKKFKNSPPWPHPRKKGKVTKKDSGNFGSGSFGHFFGHSSLFLGVGDGGEFSNFSLFLQIFYFEGFPVPVKETQGRYQCSFFK